MDGGVVTIRFEADTTNIEASIKNIEKSVGKINLSTYKAETSRISAEARKLKGEAQKIAAQTQKIQAQTQKHHQLLLKTNNAYRQNYQSIEKAKIKVAQTYADTEKTVAEAKKLGAEYKKQNPDIDKNRAAASLMRAEFNAQHEDLVQQKADTAEVNANARLLREENRKNGLFIKKNTKSTLEWYGAYYMITRAISQITQGLKDIGKSIKNIISFGVQLYSTLFKIMTPLSQLLNNFLKTSGIGNKIKQLFSFNSISNFAKSAIEAASDLTEVQNIVDTAFPNMADKMNAWAEDSINAFGLSEKSAKQYAATLGLMAQSAGLAERASYTLGTGLTAVTADLASMYNMNAEAVYERIRSGVIGGRTMAIAQLGINMSQANLQAYMESKGISEKYNSLDNATKTVIRYNYVLEQTRKIQGDFIKTQGTWANQTRILSENITALKAALGEFLVSVLTPLLVRVNGLLQLLTKAVNKIKEILPLLGIKLQKAAGSGNGASSGLEDLSDGLEDAGYAADEAGKKIAKLTDGPFSEMHKVGDDGTSIATKMKDIFGGDGLLQYESKDLPDNFKKVETWLDRILKKLNFTELFAELKRLLGEIKGWIDAIRDAWQRAWNSKGIQVLQSIIDAVTQIIGLVNDMSKAFRDMFNNDYGFKIFEAHLTTVQKIAETIEKVVKRFREAWNSGSGHYGNVYTEQGLENRRKLTPEELAAGKRHQSMFGGPDGFRTHTGVAGTQIMANQSEFRELTWGEYLASQFYEVVLSIQNLEQAILDFIGLISENIDWEGIFGDVGNVLDKFKTTLDNLAQFLKDNPQLAEQIGRIIGNIVDGLSNLIIDCLDWFDTHKEALPDILNFIEGLSKHTEEIAATAIAIKLLGPALAGVGRILVGSALTKVTWTTFFGKAAASEAAGEAAGAAGTSFGAKLWSALPSAAALAAGVTEMGFILYNNFTKVLPETWEKIKNEGLIHTMFNPDWWLIEVPNMLRGPISTFVGETIASLLKWLWKGWTETIWPWLKSLPATFASIAEEICNAITKVFSGLWSGLKKDFERFKEEVSNTTIGKAVGGTVNYIKTKFTGNHANGGVWAPNQPRLAVLGDHPSQTEYALTEGHLDNIADRMASGIINGFARVSLAGAGSGSPNIYVQIGDREIKDLIVQTVNEENYRRF